MNVLKNVVIFMVLMSLVLVVSPTSSVFASAFENEGTSNSFDGQITKRINDRFAGLKNSDKVLPVDGGYVYGEAIEGDLINGDIKNSKSFNSSANVKSITVAKAKQIEFKNAKNDISIGTNSFLPQDKMTRFVNPPTKTWKLRWQDSTYISGGFGGTGWQYAGYLFYNEDALNGNTKQSWSVYGDSAQIGDISDLYSHTGVILYPNGKLNTIWPTSGIYLSFVSYNPKPGSGYMVKKYW